MYKMLLLVQIGSIYNINKLISKIIKYNSYNNLYIFSIMENIELDLNKFGFHNLIILHHKNIGMDIGPYLLQIKWIINNLHVSDYDYIYKIHTKTKESWFNELTELPELLTDDIHMCKKWSLNLDSLNKTHINQICNDFNLNNIYYDVHDTDICYNDVNCDFYSSYYDVPITNNNHIIETLGIDINKQYIIEHAKYNNNIVNENQILIKRRKKVKFCGGSIFIIKYNLVYDYFKNIDIDRLYSILEPGYTINIESTNVHALERIISSFFIKN